MSIINILSCLVQCALHFACKLLKCFRAYTIFNDCFFSYCFSTLKRFPIGVNSGLAKLLQSIRQQVAKIVETLHLLGALLIFLLSLTLQPPSPHYQCCYGGHWKLEKVFFNESVSTILQLVVGQWLDSHAFLDVRLLRANWVLSKTLSTCSLHETSYC